MGASSSALAQGVSAEDLTAADPKPSGWWAALALGGKLYGVPCSAERLLIYDPTSGVSSVDTRLVATGEGKWRSAVAIGGKIFGVPDRAEHLLTYDVASGRVGGVPTSQVARGPYKWQAAVALGGKVYGIPHHADKVLVYDPGTNKVAGVSTAGIATGPSKWVAAVVLGGKLYGVPCNSSSILVYDPASNKVGRIDIGHMVTGHFKWLAAVAYDGKLFAVPCHAECILIYDPRSGEVRTIDTTSVAIGAGKWLSAIALGGRIYGIPDHANAILVFDVATESVWGIDVTHIAEGPFKWQSAVAMGGKIYAVPHNAEAVLVFDPVTEEASGVDTSAITAGQGKWGMTAVIGGRLCGLPYDSTQLLLYEPEKTTIDVHDRSEHLPSGLSEEYLQDFLAGWLSEWIYWIEDVSSPSKVGPVTVGGEAVVFTVHNVYEDPLQGTPARLATVTADIPGRSKVVYMVFKGTAYLADWVVNGSVAPDFMPFHQAFEDNTTFVHHGAFHAVAQLRVHQWTALLEQLRSAESEGIQHLIVTGHSLGGQYALTFLFQVFLEERRKAWLDEPELLKKVRCVSFGSPMSFGAREGMEVRQDLKDYLREKAVNYINGGDPTPRLWSELNLMEFMRYFIDDMRGKMSSFSQRVVDYAAGPGGVIKRAQEFLNRTDIEVHLHRPASRYVHLSRIRVLAKEFVPWRPLQQEHMCLEDHEMYEGYLPAFRASADPGWPGSCFDEDGNDLVETFQQKDALARRVPKEESGSATTTNWWSSVRSG